jgi:hypothetical protein
MAPKPKSSDARTDVHTEMPIKHAIWKIGRPAQRLSEVTLATEQTLEQMIVSDARILSD